MSLEEYNKKRDFTDTDEPKGDYGKGTGRFVVQRHEASRLHYDLRLEIGGTLKSWAVPKGPSMNPEDKRLAVQTEDHPVKYLDYSGIIPEGNYGAGVMNIWDKGKFNFLENEGENEEKAIEEGSAKIRFKGEKLKGDFSLVRMKTKDNKSNWLLIKNKDRYAAENEYSAEDHEPITDVEEELNKNNKKKKEVVEKIEDSEARKDKLSKPIKPMLAKLAKEAFDSSDWLFETKWDGYRIIAEIKEGTVRLYSRNGNNLTKRYPLVTKELEAIGHDAVLDGELVMLDNKGIPRFQWIQKYERNKDKGYLAYYVFDMLELNGYSMIDLPLKDRKSLIKDVIGDSNRVRYSQHIEEKGQKLFKEKNEAGFEGIIAKKRDSKYNPGARSDSWLKIKGTKGQEAIICGYTNSDKSGRKFGSLLLGVFEEEGSDKLKYIGNVGSGFSQDDQKALMKKFNSLERKTSPFDEEIDSKYRDSQWLTPKLICEVHFTEWTKDGRLRHPVFKALRHDKEHEKIIREKSAKKAPERIKATNSKKVESNKEKSKNTKKDKEEYPDSMNAGGKKVPISSPEKLYWKEEGIRKYDVLEYYDSISEYIMPYLRNRPHNLHRHPNGIESDSFYQKDMTGELPKWGHTVEVHSDSADKNIDYLVCRNMATLIYMANLGCIEINPWLSKEKSIDAPDYVVIDLDPSEKNSFDEVIDTAQTIKEILDRYKIIGRCKTSGSKGLHIYIPLKPKYDFDQAREFCRVICVLVNRELKKLTTLERSLNKRKGRIYLDYMQNRSGQTLAAPYSLRPKAGAPVSMPLEWGEVKKGLKITDFNIHNALDRVKEKGDIFSDILNKENKIEDIIERMEG